MKEIDSKRMFLDSSVWLAYFLGQSLETKKIIESDDNTLFASIISLHEIFKKLKKIQTEKETLEKISFIENIATIIGLNKESVIDAVNNCEKYGLHTIDSLIYTTAAQNKIFFVTTDNHFCKTPNTKIIKLQ